MPNYPSYVNCHQHSDASLLDGLPQPKQIVERAKELGYSACALSDHGVLSNTVTFYKECKKANIRPILAVELYLTPNLQVKERGLSHLVVLAKNLQGWKQLIRLTSTANLSENFYYKPRLDLTKLSEFCDGSLISFSGHLGSDLANCLFIDPKSAYRVTELSHIDEVLHPHWEQIATNLAEKYREIFGKDNWYIEIQIVDRKHLVIQDVVADCLRKVSRRTGIPCIATADSHYCRREDAIDQRVLLCSALQTTMIEVKRKLEQQEDVSLGGFFRSNNYHMPSQEEMLELHREYPEEVAATEEIASKCEIYDILSKPRLPKFESPTGESPEEYLRILCRTGWISLIKDRIYKERHGEYADRVKKELGVIEKAGLSSYFLMVQDYVTAARGRGDLLSPGRGSGAGTLVGYLSGITKVDPIKYNLIFERFYNEGRNTKDNIKLPDFDCDFPISTRHLTVDYIRNKYGHDRVAQMATYGRLMGRGALKEVLRAHGAVSFDEMNRITEHIPNEAAISDHLQHMQEEEGESSILKWALENNPKELSEWAEIRDNGEIEGPLAEYFKQAIRLEGTKKSQGKHAAGVIVADVPLVEICPMVRDKSDDNLIVGLPMGDAESIGLVKCDILGVQCLDRLMGVQKLLRGESLV